MKRVIRKRRPHLHIPRIPKPEKEEMIYFASYAVFLVYLILSVSFYSVYTNAFWKPVILSCIGLLAVYELVKNGLTWRNILTVAALLILFINITRIGQGLSQNAVAALMFFVFCSRSISFNKISWYTMLISGLTLAFVVASAYLGIIENHVDSGSRNRQYLGFLYALYGPTIMSNITLLWIYRKREKITVKGAAVFFLLNLFFFMKTNSRLCFYSSVFMLVFALFLRKHEVFMLRRKLLCTGMVFSFVLAAAVSFLLTVYYQPTVPWMYSLNKMLGSRLSLGKESLINYGLKPLGIEGIVWVGNGLNMYGEKSNEAYLYVDSYYIQIAQRFGYLFLIMVLAFLTIACFKSYRNGDFYLLSIFCVLAIHFIFDNLYMYLQYNTFWLAAGILVFSGKKAASVHERRRQQMRIGRILRNG